MDLSKLKNVKFQMTELTEIDTTLYGTIGIMIGVIGAWVMILFFTQMYWVFKITSSIAEIGILGILAFQLRAAILRKRAYLEAQKIMGEN